MNLRYAPANTTPKIVKEYVLPTLNPNKIVTSENQAEREKHYAQQLSIRLADRLKLNDVPVRRGGLTNPFQSSFHYYGNNIFHAHVFSISKKKTQGILDSNIKIFKFETIKEIDALQCVFIIVSTHPKRPTRQTMNKLKIKAEKIMLRQNQKVTTPTRKANSMQCICFCLNLIPNNQQS